MNSNHYTQICKFSLLYSKDAYNQNSTECNPYLNQKYINKEALDGLYSPKKIMLQQIPTYHQNHYLYWDLRHQYNHLSINIRYKKHSMSSQDFV